MNPEFLTLEDVLEIHLLQIERFGGSSGIRDQGLLESALAQPMAVAQGRLDKDQVSESLRKIVERG